MNSSTFRKWLVARGCRVEKHMRVRHKRAGISTALVRRGDREAELPLVGSAKTLHRNTVLAVVRKLGLNPSDLPEPRSRV